MVTSSRHHQGILPYTFRESSYCYSCLANTIVLFSIDGEVADYDRTQVDKIIKHLKHAITNFDVWSAGDVLTQDIGLHKADGKSKFPADLGKTVDEPLLGFPRVHY